jgi:hypothetical protein
LNLHFHALFTDGAFTCSFPYTQPEFHPTPALKDSDVLELTRALRRRVVRYLQSRGHLPKEGADPPADDDGCEEPLLARISAASVQGQCAATGKRDERVGRRHGARPDFSPGPLCAEVDGFTLHANTLIAADDREALERLCRYTARPPIASERLSFTDDERVLYELRRPWRDGTRAIAFEPIAFIERLAALVPRPHSHLLTYHGVFAPAAAWRDLIVPSNPEEPSTAPAQDGPDSPDSRNENVEPAKTGKRGSRQRLSWAELLKRVFSIDVFVCPDCAGPRRVIATITDGPIVRKILEHLGLDADPPTMAPARLPCEPAFDW